ncbi:hypothetical protein Enr13x_47270 [Stieleria neptunia]|uniref:Uncharacterized protein n=1 Tax=Stieleria neptunia TaxID=2527979 RepID=A0A518HVH7_9BACT|nr:hypothetical protein Enr13x_47270 [Stieleria neptunia]
MGRLGFRSPVRHPNRILGAAGKKIWGSFSVSLEKVQPRRGAARLHRLWHDGAGGTARAGGRFNEPRARKRPGTATPARGLTASGSPLTQQNPTKTTAREPSGRGSNAPRTTGGLAPCRSQSATRLVPKSMPWVIRRHTRCCCGSDSGSDRRLRPGGGEKQSPEGLQFDHARNPLSSAETPQGARGLNHHPSLVSISQRSQKAPSLQYNVKRTPTPLPCGAHQSTDSGSPKHHLVCEVCVVVSCLVLPFERSIDRLTFIIQSWIASACFDGCDSSICTKEAKRAARQRNNVARVMPASKAHTCIVLLSATGFNPMSIDVDLP